MSTRPRAVEDGPAGESQAARPKTATTDLTPAPSEGGRRRQRRAVLWVLAAAILIAVPTWYVFTQDESKTTAFALSVTTSCPNGVWTPPAPGEHTGACFYLGFLDLPAVSKLSGTYAASNSSPLWVVVAFQRASYNCTASDGSFALSGTTPFTWTSAPWPFGLGDSPASAAITVVSNYPITVTFQGTYSSPPLS